MTSIEKLAARVIVNRVAMLHGVSRSHLRAPRAVAAARARDHAAWLLRRRVGLSPASVGATLKCDVRSIGAAVRRYEATQHGR